MQDVKKCLYSKKREGSPGPPPREKLIKSDAFPSGLKMATGAALGGFFGYVTGLLFSIWVLYKVIKYLIKYIKARIQKKK